MHKQIYYLSVYVAGGVSDNSYVNEDINSDAVRSNCRKKV